MARLVGEDCAVCGPVYCVEAGHRHLLLKAVGKFGLIVLPKGLTDYNHRELGTFMFDPRWGLILAGEPWPGVSSSLPPSWWSGGSSTVSLSL